MNTKLYFSIFCVAFFWGTTFLGIRIAVETIPPFFVAGIRNLLSGSLILLYLLYLRKIEMMRFTQLFRAFVLAIMMIVLANGLTTFAEKYISSGLASLISTLSPFCVLVLNLGLGNEKLSVKTSIGIVLGMSGIFLIYQDSLSDLLNPQYRLGIFAILTAVFMWSVGTIITKKGLKSPAPMLLNVAVQMIFAGLILLLLQYFISPKLTTASFSTRSEFAVLYLAVFGSVIGYVAYSYLITQWPSTKVAVLAYINVVVALFLGWLILDEIISSKMIFATLLIICGVFIVNFRKLQKKI